jgi:Ca2+-binding EF-hand superfamily protein
MLSETMKKKLTNQFHVRDLDKDGYVGREDWEQCAKNLAEIRRWKPESPEYEDIVSKHIRIWTAFWEPADLDCDGKVGLDEYLELADEQRQRGSFATDVVLQLFGAIFDIIDRDSDGQITLQDYKLYFKAWGLSSSLAKQAFSRLDLSGDGRLSRSIFIQFGSNFYLSDDPNMPGNWLFGPYE